MAGSGHNHLKALEAEAIFIMREVAAQFERPALLFSGGKDSIVLVRLAQKAFAPAKIPFPLVHIDTEHNFEEAIQYRDWLANDVGAQLIVGNVGDDIRSGEIEEERGHNPSRNSLQTHTLLKTIEKYKFDACFGGARRDEEKARAKERFFSHRDEFGQWDPKTNDQNFGICLTVAILKVNTSAYSPSRTGPKWMFGNISNKKTSLYPVFISRTSAKLFAETE